ncbi:hypothetical protein IP84_08830 [beta proteobacterium AAP99]|nr:hypothetical protein IP84_08830 [beta proteobacterium AAP99]
MSPSPDPLNTARDTLAACCKAAARAFLDAPPLAMDTQEALLQHFRTHAGPSSQAAAAFWQVEQRFMSELAAQVQMHLARACERLLAADTVQRSQPAGPLALADAAQLDSQVALSAWAGQLPADLKHLEEQVSYQVRRVLRSLESQRPGLRADAQPFGARHLAQCVIDIWDPMAAPHGGGALLFSRHAAALQPVVLAALRSVLAVLDDRYPIPVPRVVPQPTTRTQPTQDAPAPEPGADDPLHALVLFTAPELADALATRIAALRRRSPGPDLQPELERIEAQRAQDAPQQRAEPQTLIRRTRSLFEELQQLPDLSRFDPSQVETLRLLSRVFMILMRDTRLYPELHTALEDLQAPLLRTALRDAAFFTDFDHPARRAIAQLIATGMDRKVPEAQRIERLRGALKSASDLLLQSSQAARPRPAAQDETDDAAARDAAFMAVGERLTQYDMPDFVARMLTVHWSELLARAYVRSSTDPAIWIEGLRVLDRLIWSVQLRGDDRFARELTRELPSLVRSVRGGLKASGASTETTERFMKQLEAWHIKMLKATSVTVLVRSGRGKRAYRNLGQTVARLTSTDLVQMKTESGRTTTGRVLWASPAKSRFILARADRSAPRLMRDTEVRRLINEGRLSTRSSSD